MRNYLNKNFYKIFAYTCLSTIGFWSVNHFIGNKYIEYLWYFGVGILVLLTLMVFINGIWLHFVHLPKKYRAASAFLIIAIIVIASLIFYIFS